MRAQGPLPLKTKMDYYNWSQDETVSSTLGGLLYSCPLFEDDSILLLVYASCRSKHICWMTPIDNKVSPGLSIHYVRKNKFSFDSTLTLKHISTFKCFSLIGVTDKLCNFGIDI